MSEFWEVLGRPEGYFLRLSLAAGLLAAPVFGIVGSWVVVRRVSAMAGAVSHCILAGVGLALVLEWPGFGPQAGALLAGLVAAGLLTWLRQAAGAREESLVSALWAVGMSIGLLLLQITPKAVDPMSYLFGNILLVGPGDLVWMAVLDTVVLVAAFWFYRPLVAFCFDEDFAELRGVPRAGAYGMITALTAVAVVLMIKVTGMVLAIALLVLPPSTAAVFTRRLGPMMLGAAGLCAAQVAAGLVLSYVWEWPTGPLIAVLSGAVYAVAVALRGRFSRRGPGTAVPA